MQPVPNQHAIRALVRTAVQSFAAGFGTRHLSELDDPDGVINMKIHNPFIAALGEEIRFYSSLVRSFDSSLGNMLEDLAINVARLFFDVSKHVEGVLASSQTQGIAKLLEQYKRREKTPKVSDYLFLRQRPSPGHTQTRRHESDYYLVNRATKEHYLVELKIGGDLDNKKARSEKEALLEQFAILSNTLSDNPSIKLYFATAYNRYGDGKPWQQGRVLQYFSEDELLIGRNFWNFVSQSPQGYDIVLTSYKETAPLILSALEKIKAAFLKH